MLWNLHVEYARLDGSILNDIANRCCDFWRKIRTADEAQVVQCISQRYSYHWRWCAGASVRYEVSTVVGRGCWANVVVGHLHLYNVAGQ